MILSSIGFTGTQVGATEFQVKAVAAILDFIRPGLGVHGGCIGADYQFDCLLLERNIRRRVRPASRVKPSKRCIPGDEYEEIEEPRPPLERNHDIVHDVQLMIATPKTAVEVLRSGTWATVRHTKKIGKPLIVVWPDGTLRFFNVPQAIISGLPTF